MHVLIPHHLTHLAELVPVPLPHYSLQICHQHILHKAHMFTTWYSAEVQKQMELGNSTDQIEVYLGPSVLKPLHAAWLVSFYNHLTGSVGKLHIAKEWSKAGISKLVRGKTTLSPENPFEDIAASAIKLNSASVAYISVLIKNVKLLTLLNISVSCLLCFYSVMVE